MPREFQKELDSYYKKTFKDLIILSEWKDVERAMLYYYPDQKYNIPRYKEIFEEFKTMEPGELKNRQNEGRLTVSVVTDILDPEENIQSYNVTLEPYYSIGMMPWRKILGLEVSEEAQKSFTREEIVAHVLWDFTFYGFYEEDVQGVAKDLNSKIKEIKKAKKIEDVTKPFDPGKLLRTKKDE